MWIQYRNKRILTDIEGSDHAILKLNFACSSRFICSRSLVGFTAYIFSAFFSLFFIAIVWSSCVENLTVLTYLPFGKATRPFSFLLRHFSLLLSLSLRLPRLLPADSGRNRNDWFDRPLPPSNSRPLTCTFPFFKSCFGSYWDWNH